MDPTERISSSSKDDEGHKDSDQLIKELVDEDRKKENNSSSEIFLTSIIS